MLLGKGCQRNAILTICLARRTGFGGLQGFPRRRDEQPRETRLGKKEQNAPGGEGSHVTAFGGWQFWRISGDPITAVVGDQKETTQRTWGRFTAQIQQRCPDEGRGE